MLIPNLQAVHGGIEVYTPNIFMPSLENGTLVFDHLHYPGAGNGPMS